MAEREGFEPSVGLRPQRFSRPSRSTTPAPLRKARRRRQPAPHGGGYLAGLPSACNMPLQKSGVGRKQCQINGTGRNRFEPVCDIMQTIHNPRMPVFRDQEIYPRRAQISWGRINLLCQPEMLK